MNEQQSQNLLLKVDRLLLIFAQGEERETEHQLSCFSYLAAFRTAQHDINFFVVSFQKMAAKNTSGLHVSKKLKVHI